jgi:hypothetical protein
MDAPPFSRDRLEILQLRARVVALERATLASLELVLRIRPEELRAGLEKARHRLEDDYQHPDFAADINDAAERAYLAQEVERIMRALQSEMGFPEGIQGPEEG